MGKGEGRRALAMGEAPGGEGIEGGAEGFAVGGEAVFALDDFAGVEGVGENPLGFKFAKLGGEDLVADAGEGAAEFAKAAGLVFEFAKDGGLPLAADDVEGGGDGAVSGVHGESVAPGRRGACSGSAGRHNFVRNCQGWQGSVR